MKNVVVAAKVPNAAHQLDPSRIIQTAEKLAQRIGQSLPGTTLAGLAAEIFEIASDTAQRIREILKPIIGIRIGSLAAIGLTLACLWYFMHNLHTRSEFSTISEFLGAADTCFNFLVALAGGLWFFITLESRIKRQKILASIQELRELVHVIDATQLYYTPEMYGAVSKSENESVQRFDHTYLLDCSQLLGVISNLAALYTRGSADDSIMRAAADVEMLAAALTGKLYAKAEFVRNGKGVKNL